MTRTVDELRNEIRQAVDRFERPGSTAFTKESLAAICEAVGYEVETSGRLPPKPEMRAGVLWKIGLLDEPDPDETGQAFRKAELQAIADALQEKSEP